MGRGPTLVTSFHSATSFKARLQIRSRSEHWAWGFNTRTGGHGLAHDTTQSHLVCAPRAWTWVWPTLTPPPQGVPLRPPCGSDLKLHPRLGHSPTQELSPGSHANPSRQAASPPLRNTKLAPGPWPRALLRQFITTQLTALPVRPEVSRAHTGLRSHCHKHDKKASYGGIVHRPGDPPSHRVPSRGLQDLPKLCLHHPEETRSRAPPAGRWSSAVCTPAHSGRRLQTESPNT